MGSGIKNNSNSPKKPIGVPNGSPPRAYNENKTKPEPQEVLPTVDTSDGPEFLGTFLSKNHPTNTSNSSPSSAKKENPLIAKFKKSNLTVVQYFKNLVTESQPHYPDPEAHKQQIKIFYVDCFLLIDDKSPNALQLLTDLKKEALTKLGIKELSEDLKKATSQKQQCIINEQGNNAQTQVEKSKNFTFSENVNKKTPSKPSTSATSYISPKARHVAEAFQREIDRLTEKLTHWFFKWFTWNKPMVQEKIDALNTIKDVVMKDESKIDAVISNISEPAAEEENNSPPALVNYYNLQRIKQHRQGFMGKSDTHNNLINAFKHTPR